MRDRVMDVRYDTCGVFFSTCCERGGKKLLRELNQIGSGVPQVWGQVPSFSLVVIARNAEVCPPRENH